MSHSQEIQEIASCNKRVVCVGIGYCAVPDILRYLKSLSQVVISSCLLDNMDNMMDCEMPLSEHVFIIVKLPEIAVTFWQVFFNHL